MDEPRCPALIGSELRAQLNLAAFRLRPLLIHTHVLAYRRSRNLCKKQKE